MMKSVFLALLVLCFFQFVMAEEVTLSTTTTSTKATTTKTVTTKVPVKEGYGTLDMSEYNKAEAHSQAPAKKSMTVTTSCTDAVEKQHKSGDAGYDTCLINSTNKANPNPNASSKQMNVNFGN